MRYNDASPHPTKWTNAKLMRELRRIANFETAAFNLPASDEIVDDTAAIRESTRLYRDSWLNPLITEIERRFIKVRR